MRLSHTLLTLLAALLAGCGGSPSAPDNHQDPPLDDVAGAWRTIVAGDSHTCGIALSGVTYCWGLNDRQQVGDSTSTSRATPTPVATDQHFMSLALGLYTSCAVAGSGHAYCWGFYNGSKSTPKLVDSLLEFTSLAVGAYHACGLTTDGAIYCWTLIASDPIAPAPLPGGLQFHSVVGRDHRICGVGNDSSAYCWIDDVPWSASQPARQPISRSVSQLASGGPLSAFASDHSAHACAILDDASAECWGANFVGQLGTGDTVSVDTATAVRGKLRFQAISASLSATCAVATTGVGYCWGGVTSDFYAGVPTIALPGVRVASVSVGGDHTCFVTAGGAGFCAGSNAAGQLGTGTATDTPQLFVRVVDP